MKTKTHKVYNLQYRYAGDPKNWWRTMSDEYRYLKDAKKACATMNYEDRDTFYQVIRVATTITIYESK